MAATIVFMALLVALVYVLRRHHERIEGLAGSGHVTDRDRERMHADLDAAGVHRPDPVTARYRHRHGRSHAGGTAPREVGLSGGR